MYHLFEWVPGATNCTPPGAIIPVAISASINLTQTSDPYIDVRINC